MKVGKLNLHLCNGPIDEIKDNCNHDWKDFNESGCSDNKTYMYCGSCGLVCKVAVGEIYPEDCLSFRRVQLEKRMAADCKDCEKIKSVNCKKCGLLPDLCMCKHDEKLRKKYVNAEQFDDPKHKNCSECQA